MGWYMIASGAILSSPCTSSKTLQAMSMSPLHNFLDKGRINDNGGIDRRDVVTCWQLVDLVDAIGTWSWYLALIWLNTAQRLPV